MSSKDIDIAQKLLKNNTFLSDESITVYQFLSTKEKKSFLTFLQNTEIDLLIPYATPQSLNLSLFFCKEYLTHDIEAFNNKKLTNDLFHNIFYKSTLNHQEDLKIKKPIIDELVENKIIEINQKIGSTPLLHIAAVKNGAPFIQYLLNLGAKTNKLDKEKDSFASSALYDEENVEVFKLAISQKDFNPSKGNNVLSLAISKNYKKIINIILESNLPQNQDFWSAALDDYPTQMQEEIVPYYEKKLLEIGLAKSTNNNQRRIKV